jgi:hypothetical protein
VLCTGKLIASILDLLSVETPYKLNK